NLWVGLPVALALAIGAALFYWRESRGREGVLRWLLPLLRGLAVLSLVLIFTGPVLHHTRVVGEIAHLLLFVDSSQSMSLDDVSREPHRKRLTAEQLGQLPAGSYDPALKRALDALNQAPTRIPTGRQAEGIDLAVISSNLLRAAEGAATQLDKVRPDTWPNVA